MAIRISASRLKSLKQCSWKFYCNEVLKLPETTHPKTIVGSLAHSILECLLNSRHRKHYISIMSGIPSIYNCNSIARLVVWWQNKHKIKPELLEDLNSMVMVVLTLTDYFEEKADEVFKPEHEFLFTICEGKYQIKGFIDRMARTGDLMIIKDYKTQGKRFDEDELANNFQAAMYQMYVMKKFDLKASVQFIMLRHPPTNRTPYKHIQTVSARTKEELEGFESYLEYIGSIFSNFGMEHATMNFCADNPKDKGFCTYVCQFKSGLEYQSLIDANGKLVKNAFMDEILEPDYLSGEKIEIKTYEGCPRFRG
ncbi:MAG: PD-(D/E)XK nuclease family protein [bacterium]|nr:PD-(D/E)XK nuclease family protein [bacterium]